MRNPTIAEILHTRITPDMMGEAKDYANEIYDEVFDETCSRGTIILALCMTLGIYYAHNEPIGEFQLPMTPDEFGLAMGAMVRHFSQDIKAEENPAHTH